MVKIAAIIPAFNEEKAIAEVVNGIKSLEQTDGLIIDVIVVNDCSTDRTSAIASCLDCVVLNLPVNLGIGGAVQTGFKYAYKHGYEIALQVDGDGQHPPEEIPKLLQALEEEGADVVIGSRFIEGIGYRSSFLRRVGIYYFMVLNELTARVRITDSTSGFRALSRKALVNVDDYYPDQYPEPEAIILYALNGLKIKETPVKMKERHGGRSSISAIASIYYLSKVTFAMFFTYMRLLRRRK